MADEPFVWKKSPPMRFVVTEAIGAGGGGGELHTVAGVAAAGGGGGGSLLPPYVPATPEDALLAEVKAMRAELAAMNAVMRSALDLLSRWDASGLPAKTSN